MNEVDIWPTGPTRQFIATCALALAPLQIPGAAHATTWGQEEVRELFGEVDNMYCCCVLFRSYKGNVCSSS